jgi:hypothetical protein
MLVSNTGSPMRGLPLIAVEIKGYVGSKFLFNKKSLIPYDTAISVILFLVEGVGGAVL